MVNSVNQKYFSPYFICIKNTVALTNEAILDQLGLSDFKLIVDEQERENLGKRYLYLVRNEHWIMLMDDWLYTMWYNQEIREMIKLLSKKADIVTFFVGDSDESFGFSYFKQGKLIRQYEFDDLMPEELKVVINIGAPFNMEQSALQIEDSFEKIMALAQSFGIDTSYNENEIETYGRFEKESEQFIFDEGEY